VRFTFGTPKKLPDNVVLVAFADLVRDSPPTRSRRTCVSANTTIVPRRESCWGDGGESPAGIDQNLIRKRLQLGVSPVRRHPEASPEAEYPGFMVVAV